MEAESAFGFSAAAQRLADETRRHGLVVPGFRSPPRLAGVARSLRRVPGGAPVVAVQRRGRPSADVIGDMIDGIVVANRLQGEAAAQVRADLRAATSPTLSENTPLTAG
jgi:hypothetical protein